MLTLEEITERRYNLISLDQPALKAINTEFLSEQ